MMTENTPPLPEEPEPSKLEWMCEDIGCERPREGNTKKCGHHNGLARKTNRMRQVQSEKQAVQKATQREKSREKRPRIAQVSEKRRLQLIVYDKLKGPWLKGKACVVCGKPAGAVHHAEGREGELLLKVESWRPVCGGASECHERITKDSVWAIANGFSISRNQIPQ